MEFANSREHALAILVAVRDLPTLVRGFEDALVDAGFAIVSRRHEPGQRMPTPILVLRRDGRELEMHLANAIEDHLFVDREAEPVRIDMRLADPAYAESKLRDVLASRVELLQIVLLPDGDEKERRLQSASENFEWIRLTRLEDES